MLQTLPRFDRDAYEPALRARAAQVWRSLRHQEERSRLGAERMLSALRKVGAPEGVMASACRVLADEASHVAICDHVLSCLGHEPLDVVVNLPALPASLPALEHALTTFVVAGFAVAETMSVGGFVSARSVARAPLVRIVLGWLARDEVGHGAFGELAGHWLMRGWSVERRRELWPHCVAVMEEMEQKTGGPLGQQCDQEVAGAADLGAPPTRIIARGLLRSVPRNVLPRLVRLGVVPPF